MRPRQSSCCSPIIIRGIIRIFFFYNHPCNIEPLFETSINPSYVPVVCRRWKMFLKKILWIERKIEVFKSSFLIVINAFLLNVMGSSFMPSSMKISSRVVAMATCSFAFRGNTNKFLRITTDNSEPRRPFFDDLRYSSAHWMIECSVTR